MNAPMNAPGYLRFAAAAGVLLAFSAATRAGPGDILWRTSAPSGATGGGVFISPAGNVFWQASAWWEGEGYGLRVFRPDGTPLFHVPEGGYHFVAFDERDFYAVTFDPEPVVVSRDAATGDFRWRTVVPAGDGFLGGVDFGPDGDLYLCSDGGYRVGTGSVMRLSPQGDLRWNHPGFVNTGGSPQSRMAFINDLVIKVEDNTPAAVGPFGSSGGMYAIERETGAFAWWLPQGVSATLDRSPVVNQDLQRIYTAKSGAVWMISPQGQLLYVGGRAGGLAIDSKGFLYSAARGPLKMDPDLNILWERTSDVPTGWASTPALSPDESLIAVGYSVAPFMAEDTGHILIVDAGDGREIAKVPFLNTTGLSSNVQGLAFSDDGSVLYAGIVYGDYWPGAGHMGYYRTELVAIDVRNPGLDIRFDAAPPTRVPHDGAPVEVSIAAAPGRTLASATCALWFDRGAGWESRRLEARGGGQFAGTLPAGPCGEPVRYYVAAADTTGSIYTEPRFAPANALAALSADTVSPATLLNESFEAGLPAGWQASGLWHITGACSPGASCDGSTAFAYFGLDGSCAYQGSDPYQPQQGSLRLPPVDLTAVPPDGKAELSFCYTLQAEMYYDTYDVLVNGAVATRLDLTSALAPASVDLSGYAGEVVDIEFVMRVHTPAWTPHRGLQIDAVRITADTAVCGACPADLTGDGGLDFFDFLAFQNLFAAGDLQADFTGDGLLDFFDFLAFQDEFAAGCR